MNLMDLQKLPTQVLEFPFLKVVKVTVARITLSLSVKFVLEKIWNSDIR